MRIKAIFPEKRARMSGVSTWSTSSNRRVEQSESAG
jgi:hypothetical protein